jgi:Asp-tRNA(Asn)/Glu-tRNA(Gln) amidotransferase B subunit
MPDVRSGFQSWGNSDMSDLQAAVNKIIADNPDKVQQARRNPVLSGWFVGQVMKATAGQCDLVAVCTALDRRGIKQPQIQ